LKSMLWLLCLIGLSLRAAPLSGAAQPESLRAPVHNAFSFEQLTNSRYSVHAGFDDSLPEQVMANVLWAMSRAPAPDSGYREFYVATPANVYRYDASDRGLIVQRSGDHRYNSGSAFEIGVAAARPEEAGMAIQAGLLEATACGGESRGVVSCPMQWAADHATAEWKPDHPIRMVNVIGRDAADGALGHEAPPLDTLCVAASSDRSLSLPHVVGPDTFEAVLADLGQESSFSPVELSEQNLSQLCWAAYGVTPHFTFNHRQGLTVPSAMASYYLTDRIYVVGRYDVSRYRNRLAAANAAATRDHRLERVIAGDRRAELCAAAERIPATAPVYFVVCVPDTATEAAMLEAGFAGFQLFAQARALGLAGFLTAPLNRAERRAIASALELPDDHVPALVFACGEAEAAAVAELDAGVVTIVRAQPAIRRGNLQVEYRLSRAGQVRVEIFDMLGRPVKLLLAENQTSGYHAVTWDGSGENGVRLKRGTYLLVIISGGAVAKHKVNIG
jgi:nitroreductase